MSSITIQTILHEHGLGTKIDRWLALEAWNAEKAIEITAEQPQGRRQGLRRQGLPACGRDTYGSYAFGFLHVSKQPGAAVVVLHNDVLPLYRNLDLSVGAVVTENGSEFCGTERHPYELSST